MSHRLPPPHTPKMTNPYVPVETKLDDFDIEALKSRLCQVAGETPSAEKVLAMKLLRGDFIVDNVSILGYKFHKRVSFWYLVILILCIECLMSDDITNACTVSIYLYNFVYVNCTLVPDIVDQFYVCNFAASLLSSINIYTLLMEKALIKEHLVMYGYMLSSEEISDIETTLGWHNTLIIIRVIGLIVLLLGAAMMILLESSNRRFPVYLCLKAMTEKEEEKSTELTNVQPYQSTPDIDEKILIDARPSYNDTQASQNCYQDGEKRSDGLDTETLA